MSVTRSISSHLASNLLTWRNPECKEENWTLSEERATINYGKHVVKVAVAELGLLLCTLISVVETVAYTVLTATALILYPIVPQPCQFFAKLLRSSSFTVVWSAGSAFTSNLSFANVLTHESLVRCWLQENNRASFTSLRVEEQNYIVEWYQTHIEDKILNSDVELGSNVISPILIYAQGILDTVNEGSKVAKAVIESLEDRFDIYQRILKDDQSVYLLFLMNVLYIYAAGSKAQEEIPDFFAKATKKSIRQLRETILSNQDKQILNATFRNRDGFEARPREGDLSKFIHRLMRIASKELNNSLFMTACLEKAKSDLRNKA